MVLEVDVPSVADQPVGKAAGLGALAAVGAASAERLAGEALAGIGHEKLHAARGVSALVSVICVEAWRPRSGQAARIRNAAPTSCTSTASTPAAATAATMPVNGSHSSAKTSVLSVA